MNRKSLSATAKKDWLCLASGRLSLHLGFSLDDRTRLDASTNLPLEGTRLSCTPIARLMRGILTAVAGAAPFRLRVRANQRPLLPSHNSGGQRGDGHYHDQPDYQPADGAQCGAGWIAGRDDLGVAASAAGGGHEAGTQAAAEDAEPAGGSAAAVVFQSSSQKLLRGGNSNRYGCRCPQLNQSNPHRAVNIGRT
jgi:hypothetical protein